MGMYSVRVPDDLDLKARLTALALEREPQWATLVRALEALEHGRADPPAAGAPDLAGRLEALEQRMETLEQAPTTKPGQPPAPAPKPGKRDTTERDRLILSMASQTPRPTNPEIGQACGCSEATVRRTLAKAGVPGLAVT